MGVCKMLIVILTTLILLCFAVMLCDIWHKPIKHETPKQYLDRMFPTQINKELEELSNLP